MANFNNCTFIGNMTRDPQTRTLQSGTGLCSFGIAVNRRYKSREGEQQEETLFLEVTAWGKLAEIVGNYAKKGKSVLVSGRLKEDRWTDPEGQPRTKIGLVAEVVQFLERAERQGDSSAPAAKPPCEAKTKKPDLDNPYYAEQKKHNIPPYDPGPPPL